MMLHKGWSCAFRLLSTLDANVDVLALPVDALSRFHSAIVDHPAFVAFHVSGSTLDENLGSRPLPVHGLPPLHSVAMNIAE